MLIGVYDRNSCELVAYADNLEDAVWQQDVLQHENNEYDCIIKFCVQEKEVQALDEKNGVHREQADNTSLDEMLKDKKSLLADFKKECANRKEESGKENSKTEREKEVER